MRWTCAVSRPAVLAFDGLEVPSLVRNLPLRRLRCSRPHPRWRWCPNPRCRWFRISPLRHHCIREGKQPALVSAMQTGAKEGMVTLERCLKGMVQQGVISAEVAKAATDRD